MVNRLWESVVFPIIRHASPKHIVEVGSEEGKTTRKILDFCSESDCILTAIDPMPLFNIQELVDQYKGKFFFHKDLSLNRIYELENIDMIFLDGDHNWYTVYHELKMLEKLSDNSKFPIVFLHDCGWPYGRRDLYYNPELIPSEFLKPYKKQGVVPWQHDLVEVGFNMNLYNSIYENNYKNGVYTAVEDFLKETNKEIFQYNIEAFHGLTILFEKENAGIIDSINVNKLIRDLENERVNNLVKNKISDIKKQGYIKNNELKKKLLDDEIARLITINKELHIKSDEQIKEIQVLREEQIKEMQVLREENSVLKNELNEYERKIQIYKENQLQNETVSNELEKVRIEKERLDVEYQSQIKELKKRINNVKIEISNSARYKLGNLLIEGSQKPVSFLKIPYNIFKIFKERQSKKQSAIGVISVRRTMQEEVCTQPTIIIPIFNAYEEVKECLKSIFEYTTEKYNLLLINDCSTDKRIDELLNSYKDLPHVLVINNKENLGFIKNVNNGMMSVKSDVILLNSDTIVTSGWVRKLINAAYSSAQIGTVTPLSNNAGPFSVPEQNYNVLPDNYTVNKMGQLIEKAGVNSYLEVPTGHGFCLYIKRKTIDDVGLFDDITFGKGYCEENDFCMRALKKGWKNIIDDKTYIYHTESASFMESKAEIREINRMKLIEKHPEYPKLVKAFVTSKEIKQIRERVKRQIDNYEKN